MSLEKERVTRFFEWIPLDSAGLVVAIISLLSREIDFSYQGYDIPFIIAVSLVAILAALFTAKKMIPGIDVFTYDQHNNEIKLKSLSSLDASNGEVEVDLLFKVPDHHEEVYLSFDIDGYTVGIEQYTPVNYDQDIAVTCHSKIQRFELTLKLVPNSSETNQGSRRPLEIVDKLHNIDVCQISVNG
ncbi:hypothetical protein [Natronococcus occultus]|uniref:hypothetical protein n=1 Tax=Natronococcus occultus TaxID=29288 RepID=UPI0012F89A2A|nr:hypothetical protein [Natronococcus occultus]